MATIEQLSWHSFPPRLSDTGVLAYNGFYSYWISLSVKWIPGHECHRPD